MTTADDKRTVLVVGAYGLIGSGVARALVDRGHRLVALGRDANVARRVLPRAEWRFADMRDLLSADDWVPFLEGVDVVVNCSGVLQDGPGDGAEVVHHHAVAAMAQACATAKVQVVQVSAVGAEENASTEFLASKARGDAAIRASGARFQILRPGLVLAQQAYGGSLMLRMLAAVPLVQPIALPDAPVQTVALDDVAAVVVAAVEGALADGLTADLVEPEAQSLQDTVTMMRQWLGFAPARAVLKLPDFALGFVGKFADGLSWLGWRSPLRTTALTILREGIKGTPEALLSAGQPALSALPATLDNIPARAEDRLAARMSLLMPVIMVGLVLFWFASGVIGIIRLDQAAQVLTAQGWPFWLAALSVVFWSIIDIAIAAGLALRRYARAACLAAVAVSLFYLVASTLFVPSLWLDPLGPLVKVVPSILLALVAYILLEQR